MKEIILNLCYELLTTSTLSFISIFIPFMGGYWLYKHTTRLNAEIKIFEIGRAIKDILQENTNVKCPILFEIRTHVEKNLSTVNENNRNKALATLFRNKTHSLVFEAENTDTDLLGTSLTTLGIIAERFENLTPQGIEWSGKGNCWSTYGEKITLEDQLFPFGTKLFKEWIGNFTYIYNDIWAFNSFRPYRENCVKTICDKYTFLLDKDLTKWIDDVWSTTKKVHKEHSNLITQLQIIESSINEEGFLQNIKDTSLFLVLGFISGYLFPYLLNTTEVLTIPMILGCLIASILSVALILTRLLITSNTKADIAERRKILLPELKKHVSTINGEPLKYNITYLNNILSLSNDLSLPNTTIALIKKLTKEIDQYNEYGRIFYEQSMHDINALKEKFKTQEMAGSGRHFSLQEFANPEKLNDIITVIETQNNGFCIVYKEQYSSKDLLWIALKNLDITERKNLKDSIITAHTNLNNLASFTSLIQSQIAINDFLTLLTIEIDCLLTNKLFYINRWLKQPRKN